MAPLNNGTTSGCEVN